MRARRGARRSGVGHRLFGPGTDGAIYAVSRNGAGRRLALPAGTLTEPGGIAVGRDGLYVTSFGGSPGGGRVLRLRYPWSVRTSAPSWAQRVWNTPSRSRRR
jgi:hypothetical protein